MIRKGGGRIKNGKLAVAQRESRHIEPDGGVL